jgi:hypothetical protein
MRRFKTWKNEKRRNRVEIKGCATSGDGYNVEKVTKSRN